MTSTRTGRKTWKTPPGWQKLRALTFATYGHTCWRCGRYATTIDHVRPVILGGTHDPSNLRPCCAHCNSASGAAVGNRLRARRARWVTSRRW